MSFRFKISGVKAAERNIKRTADSFREQAKRALAEELKIVLREAVKITPKDSGRLRQSGRVTTPHGGKNVSFNIVFGGVTIRGESVDYAVAVHEDLMKKFKNGESEFLAKTWARMAPGIEKRIGRRIKLPVKLK